MFSFDFPESSCN